MPSTGSTCRTACTATASGSTSAPASSLTSAPRGKTFAPTTAVGIWTSSAKPPGRPYAIAVDQHTAQRLYRPSLQRAHSMQGTIGEAVTRSPTASPVTSPPTSTTSPTNSWPITWPGSTNAPCRYECRSDPQIPHVLTLTTTASASTAGAGTSSTWMSSTPLKTAALTGGPPSCPSFPRSWLRCGLGEPVEQDVPEEVGDLAAPERAGRAEPLVGPVDHPEQGQGREPGVELAELARGGAV